MARFDVYARDGEPLLLDCQTDLLSGIETRLVVPLLPSGVEVRRFGRLTPMFSVDGVDVLMMTPLMAAVPSNELGPRIASLADEQDTIMGAIDMLLSGF